MRFSLVLLLALVSAPALAQQQIIDLDISGGVLGYALSTGSTPLAGIPPSTKRITFINPSGQTVYVCPAFDILGHALTPGPNPGSTIVGSGDSVIVSGSGVLSTSWLAATATGSDVPFTLFVSPNP